MKTRSIKTSLILAATLAFPLLASAANVSMIASDANGAVTSLNGPGQWSDGQAPSAANDYFSSTFFIRTPADAGNITTTFAGHSLTLQKPAGQGAPMRSILFKGAAGDVTVINNLTNAAGSVLNNGGSGAISTTFTGNLWTIAGNSTLLSDQGPTIIGYPLAGSGSVILTNTSGQSRTITYTGDLSAFTGKFYINSTCTVALGAGSSNLGNPVVFTPDQIDIGAGCVFEDDAGLTFNNANGGFTLAGNATINSTASTIIAEPITDNGGNYSLTLGGSGMINISVPSAYSGGTIISGGVLQIGVANALVSSSSVTNNGTLDLNGISAAIDGLSGSGNVDTTAGAAPTLTIGVNGGGGTFSGTIQNSSGALSVTKVGAGTETFSGAYLPSGTTTVAGGTLNLTTAPGVASVPGDLVVTNGAVLTVDVSSGNSLPANNLVLGNSTNVFNYGTVTANPTAPAINAAGDLSAPGANIVITITATGLQPGTFTLIKYGTGTLAGIANFQLSPPPGVAATLVNNTLNHSIDLNIASIPNQLAWNGVNGASWNLSTPNWMNTVAGGITVFRQYTNGDVIAGDAVTFDDTLTNDFINPQPTNITLNSTFYAFPVVVNSSLPYSIAGTGGIAGVTSLALSGSGSLTLLTSNSFSGGVNIANTALTITNDSALGNPAGPVTFNGGALQINGSTTNNVRAFNMPALATIGVAANNTVRLGGVISGTGASFNKTDEGTLILAGRETFTGDLFIHAGTVIIDSGGSITNGSFEDVGQNGSDAATLTLQSTGSLLTTSDFNLGDLDDSSGTLNMLNSATLTVNQFFIGSANAAGSTASGTVNQSGGTITEVSTAVGAFAIGGRTSTSGVGVYNLSGGTVTANAGVRVGGTGSGTLNQSGGTFNALQGINIARIAGSFGTNNLNGGTLATFNVASSTGVNAIFNFNGGTLLAAFNPATPWMSGLSQANILAGGAIIDSSNFNVTITQPLLAGSANGGLTKKGAGTLTLSGVNTFTGPITNSAGTLILNSASTYPGAVAVNAGTLQMTTASVIQGGTTVANNALLSVNQAGSGTASLGSLTFNGAATGPGATLGLTPATGNNPNVALVNCGTLTLNGTNTISLAAVNVGTIALIKAIGPVAGSGNIANLVLPQGAVGTIATSFDGTFTTVSAIITSTGPGLVWTGTNSVSPNAWDIGVTTNWLVNSTPTSYHQIVTPGDAVIFNDLGSGAVILNTSVSPSSIVISNDSKIYTFSGSGSISGSTGLLKLGSNTAILSVTNNNYSGDTAISNGTLQVVNNGTASGLSPTASLVIGPGGTLSLSSQQANATTTVGEFSGSGAVSYTGGINSILAFGGSAGGVWNGTIGQTGGAGLSLTKTGSGTWVVGGTNRLNNSDFFNAVSQDQFNGGTTIITNGGWLGVGFDEFWIAYNPGSTSTVVVAGGTLAVSNNWLRVGYNDLTANGTLIVNSGTVIKAGANNIDVGANTATGTLIVNGGQVLNGGPLWLGDGAGANGTLQLNGGLVQASQVLPNATPLSSTINFNGGTLQAATNSADFIQSVPMIQSGGAVLDDGGFAVSIASQSFQEDPSSVGGGLIKKGAGALYLDSFNSYPGTTVVTNGTLAGIGGVSGPMLIAPGGTLGAGDAGSVGLFSIYNSLALQGNVRLRIDKTAGSPSEDQVIVNGDVSYGGILTITNTTSDATPLTTSDTFQLFSASGSKSGNFTGIAGSPGTGLAYHFDPASGLLSIVTQTMVTNPTNISFSVSGNTLTLSWPADHLGWALQAQTNSLSTGLTASPGSWYDVPGSTSVTNVVITINPKNPTVFYRMTLP